MSIHNEKMGTRRFLSRARFQILTALAVACGIAWAADRLRLDGVLYVEDYVEKPVELKALNPTLLTFSRDGSAPLDNIRAGQHVRLLGIGEDRYLVRARVTNGRADGWVVASDMEPIPESVIKELETKSAAAEKVKKAVARGEIEIGMTQDAVEKVLGKTKVKSKITDANGAVEQWTYPAYKTVPYQVHSVANGTNYVSLIQRKVQVGATIVTFQDSKVIRFEKKQDETAPYQKGQIQVPSVDLP
ncbi:MAG: hypothetical protein HY360_13700 [Verrucomicrobia bacterium]|nr:hypothetical protein [Verrucomicrobiota bacterium]